MTRLIKKDREELRRTLRELERGYNYLMRPTIHVAMETKLCSSDVLHREGFDGLRVLPITKEYGSDLVGLKNAIDALGAYLATH